jgi:hypothetical protein
MSTNDDDRPAVCLYSLIGLIDRFFLTTNDSGLMLALIVMLLHLSEEFQVVDTAKFMWEIFE